MPLSNPIPDAVRFGEFEMHPCEGILTKKGIRVRLRPQAFRVLTLLVSHHGELVTRQAIRQNVWGEDVFVDFEHGLNLCIQEVRSVLGDHALRPLYVETEPRKGYRFIAPVEEIHAGASHSTEAQLPKAAHVPSGINGWQIRVPAYVTVIAVIIAVYGWLFLVQSRNPEQPITLAVLPFVNLSGDPEQEYLVDGVTEAVITDLAQIGSIRVIARTSTMQYKRAEKPLREIVRELRADVVIEGSVIRLNNQVRVTAQLIHAPTQTHLWARSFERDLQNILSLQREVARAIADEIRIKLTPVEESKLVFASAIRPEIYEAYLKGRYFLNARAQDALEKSIAHFQQAIDGDPQFAPAYAGLADAYALSGHYGSLPPKQAYPKAKEAAIKALEIDTSLAEAHTSLALVRLYHEWDFASAEQSLLRAIALNPSYSTAHHGYAMCLAATGKVQEAIVEIRRARELDPLSLIITAHEGWIYYLSGRYQEAAEAYRRALEMDSDFAIAHWGLGVLNAHQRNDREAIRSLQLAVETSRGNPEMVASLAAVYAVFGKTEEALKLLAGLEEMAHQRPVSGFDIALIYVALGQSNEAISHLKRAYEERAPQLVWIKTDHRFQRIHTEPRFVQLADRIGL